MATMKEKLRKALDNQDVRYADQINDHCCQVVGSNGNRIGYVTMKDVMFLECALLCYIDRITLYEKQVEAETANKNKKVLRCE